MDKNVQKKGIRGRARLIVAGKKDYIITLISFVSVTILIMNAISAIDEPLISGTFFLAIANTIF